MLLTAAAFLLITTPLGAAQLLLWNSEAVRDLFNVAVG